mmetsp:Transcript_149425/g.260595  ORF Transcript_149425/g.260595 Transcript_149425/m.260595 type:complete len:129 (-) Transcript_149425:294-680(-)
MTLPGFCRRALPEQVAEPSHPCDSRRIQEDIQGIEWIKASESLWDEIAAFLQHAILRTMASSLIFKCEARKHNQGLRCKKGTLEPVVLQPEHQHRQVAGVATSTEDSPRQPLNGSWSALRAPFATIGT